MDSLNKEHKTQKYKIKIIANGPYIVSGGIPLSQKTIVPDGKSYAYGEERALPHAETYALCRCGHTGDAPFCDGSHEKAGYTGLETASKEPYFERAELLEGSGLDMYDDGRCAFARFCHRQKGDAWELLEKSDIAENRDEVIKACMECPSGRLTARDKDGHIHEPEYEPAIEILEDPPAGVSCGISVKGGIPIEGADGQTYPTQNRVVLCRCGQSNIKPFCDSSHFMAAYVAKSRED